MPRHLRTLSRDTLAQQDQHRLVRTGRLEGNLDLGFELLDPDRDFQECPADGLECCPSPFRSFWSGSSQFEQEPIGTGMKEHAA